MGQELFTFFLYLGICALIASIGKRRSIGFGWSFILCLFASPIIGLIITLLCKKVELDVPGNNNEQ